MRTRNVIILSIVLIVLSAIVTSFVLKAGPSKDNVKQAEAVIMKLSHNTVTITKTFPSIGNLQGFLVSSKQGHGQTGILYYNTRYHYLISGQIIQKDGQNLAEQDYGKYVEPKAAVTALKMAPQTAWIQQGKVSAPKHLYVVVDPNCIFCHRMYEQLQPMIKDGKLAVRWIVVGMIKPSSKAKAEAILGATNPAQALAINEEKFNEKIEEGGITPAKNPSTVTSGKLMRNMKFVKVNSLMATPVLVYKTTAGVPQVQQGLPQGKKYDAMMNSMGKAF